MADKQVLFKNMRPTPEERTYADSVVQSILAAAPYDSRALALLEKTEDGYRCSIDIYSQFGGPFIGEAVAPDPARALDKLAGELWPSLSRRFA